MAEAAPADPPVHDPELINRIRRGDEEAFEVLFLSYYPTLCEFVATRVGSHEAAVELVQEMFIRIWERRITLDPLRPINRYLYRAARNRALDHLKHQRAQVRLSGTLRSIPPSRPATPEESLRLNEISEAVRHAVEQLPERRREIFLLSRECELSYAQIADLLEISVKTVETQMGRALKALRSALSSYIEVDARDARADTKSRAG